MAIINALDRTRHFDEFNDPIINSAVGTISPASRKAIARGNLGLGGGSVTAGVATASSPMVTDAAVGISGFRDTRPVGIFKQAAPAAKTGATTLTAAEIMGGLITGVSAAGANVNYQLPLASALETALLAIYPGLSNDDAFEFTLINTSAVATDTITITTNTGWTLVGQMVVDDQATAGNASAGTFRVRRTAANTYTIYRVSL